MMNPGYSTTMCPGFIVVLSYPIDLV